MQISNVTLAWKNSDFLKMFQLRAWLQIYMLVAGLCRAQNKTVVILNKLFKTKILSG